MLVDFSSFEQIGNGSIGNWSDFLLVFSVIPHWFDSLKYYLTSILKILQINNKYFCVFLFPDAKFGKYAVENLFVVGFSDYLSERVQRFP